MLNKLITLLITLPLAIILIVLSVANRGPVAVTMDPINPGNPALTTSMPLFMLILLAVMMGVILGSVVTWFKQGKHRRAMRAEAERANALKRETDALNKERQAMIQQATDQASQPSGQPAASAPQHALPAV